MKTSFPHMRPQMQNTETGIVYELPINGDPILEHVEDRLKSIVPGLGHDRDGQFKGDGGETLRVRRYLGDGVGFKGGDYHPPHTDWYERPGMGKDDALLITLMIYMTTPEEGGQTNFPDAHLGKEAPGPKGYNFQPKRGDLAIWWSCTKDGKQDMKSMHQAIPVRKGIKWNATRFIYDKTQKCSTEYAKSIQVPKVALNNKPQTNSLETLFGITMPEGVTTGPQGTTDSSENSDVPDFDDGSDYSPANDDYNSGDAMAKESAAKEATASGEHLTYDDLTQDEQDWQNAFMDSLSKEELEELAKGGVSDALTQKMQAFAGVAGKADDL